MIIATFSYPLPLYFFIMKTQFKVTGMTCESCKSIIEDIAKDFQEITSCSVELDSGRGWIEHQDGFDLTQFKDEINKIDKYQLEFIS